MILAEIICALLKGVVYYLMLLALTINTNNWWSFLIFAGILTLIDCVFNLFPSNHKIIQGYFEDTNLSMIIYYLIFGVIALYLYSHYYSGLDKVSKSEWVVIAVKIGAISLLIFVYNYLYRLILNMGSNDIAECFAANTTF